jgi:hypothetical protein
MNPDSKSDGCGKAQKTEPMGGPNASWLSRWPKLRLNGGEEIQTGIIRPHPRIEPASTGHNPIFR